MHSQPSVFNSLQGRLKKRWDAPAHAAHRSARRNVHNPGATYRRARARCFELAWIDRESCISVLLDLEVTARTVSDFDRTLCCPRTGSGQPRTFVRSLWLLPAVIS